MFDQKFIQKKVPKMSHSDYKRRQQLEDKVFDKKSRGKIDKQYDESESLRNINAKFKLELLLIKRRLEVVFEEEFKKREDFKVDLDSLIKMMLEESLQNSPNKLSSIKEFVENIQQKETLYALLFERLSKKFDELNRKKL